MLTFVMGIMIPVLVIQVVSYSLNNRYMTKKIDELTLMNLTQMAERANLTLSSYTNLLYQIYIDESIVENINIILEENASGKAAAYNQIINRLKQYNVAEEGIRCISIVCSDGSSVTYDYKTGSFLENLWSHEQDMRKTLAYQNAIDEPGMVVTPTQVFKENEDEDTYVFHISKRIFDLENLNKGSIATAIMSVDAQVLSSICESQYDPVTNEEYAISFILGENREVVTYPQEMFMGINVDSKLSILDFIYIGKSLTDKEIVVNAYQDSRTKWTFYYAYDKEYLLKDMTSAQSKLLVLGTVALLVSALLITYIVRKISGSVSILIQGMNQVKEGNFEISLPIESEDELGEITGNFNEMATEINTLIEQVKDATDRQKNAEVRALEAQINPHFLYNTLDSINWMAIEKGEYEISNMLRNLGVILRYSVSNSTRKVSILELGDWLEKYISLQQMRFNRAFSYSIHIDECVNNTKVHKLLLQPFIENAIIHGFDGMESGGVLRVDIVKEEKMVTALNRVCIIIEDNGKGIPKELIKQYNDRSKAVADGKGIGMHNAFARMEMYYGADAEWLVSGMEGMGTVITLKIPVEESFSKEAGE